MLGKRAVNAKLRRSMKEAKPLFVAVLCRLRFIFAHRETPFRMRLTIQSPIDERLW